MLWRSQNFKFASQGASEGSGSGSGGPYIERITNDAREDEMEENMQAVGSKNSLANLMNFVSGRLCAIQLEGNVSSHGRRDREAEQAAGQDQQQDRRRRCQHWQGQY